jgi:pseudouridine synthase
VLESLKGVSVDGVPVKAAEAARLFAFHKPSGLITAERDPTGRPTIYTALRNALPPGTPRLMPVGRLDLNTEGLLLLTNDGELKRAMELPASGIPRTYRARTFGDISQNQLEELIEGVTIEGMHYGKIDANLERKTGRNQWIELTLTEGKNREVRRVLEHLGLQVSRLLRTSYGPFELLDLPRGAAVEIRQVEVERFVKGLKSGAAQERVNPHTVKARPVSTWTKPAPIPAAPMAPAREPEARSYRAGKPFGGQPKSEGWTPHARDGAPRDEERPRRTTRSSPVGGGGRRETADGGNTGNSRRLARAAPSPEGARSARPPRKSDDRDRGEKLIDRPKAPRAKPAGPKPSGWAKASPRKPGPRGKGPGKK